MMRRFTRVVGRINRFDIFSPYLFLPLVLVLYFGVSFFDFNRFDYFSLERSIWPSVAVALIAYYVGVVTADRRGWTFPDFGLNKLKGVTVPAIWTLAMIGAISYAGMLATGQIGLSDASIRRNLDPKLNFLSHLLWFGAVLLLSLKAIQDPVMTKKKARLYSLIYFGSMVLFLLMGYETPVAVMLFTGLIIFHYVIKRIHLTWILGGMFAAALFFSMFGFAQFLAEDPSREYNSREQPDVELSAEKERSLEMTEEKVDDVPKWVRQANAEMVTGHIVLSKIIEYTDSEGYLKGQINASVFNTLFPGQQISPRTQVTEIVNSISVEDGRYITRPTRGTAPTFIGQLYLDGGNLLVAIGFLMYGIITTILFNQVQKAGIRSYQTVAYAFVMTIFTVSIHTGLLDFIFILMIGFVILTAAIEFSCKDE